MPSESSREAQTMRAQALYRERLDGLRRGTDRLFAWLMVFQFVVGIATALTVSPRTWAGSTSRVHFHVELALFLGGAISALPVYLALRQPGTALTRHVIAVGQTLWSALLIHLMGGRIETHFHVFGSLAFLSFYRDVRVLVTATAVVAADHLLRGLYWPESVYGLFAAGAWRWLEHAAWVLFEDVFLVISCVRGQRELSEMCAAQARVESTAETIECEVIERTHQLEVARDQAMEASRMKSEFLANMSHEIRTPMNGVLGFVELLDQTPLSVEQRAYVETVRSSGELLLNVLNDILDYSKIESGKLELEVVSMNLEQEVEKVADLLAPVAEKRGLEFLCSVRCPDSKWFRGDPLRLRQILNNLTGNAVKFTERGEVSLTVQVEHDGPGRARARFEVRDTGIGIPADKLPILFQAFRQADGSTTRRFGGTGLGLAICKRLAERMQGTITVRSTPGAGSTFTVELPLEPVASPELAPGSTADLRGLHVLIVDDNENNRILLQEWVKTFGCRPVCAASAREALAILRAGEAGGPPLRLALIDYQMPDMHGMALAQAIRAEGLAGEMRLVLLTSVSLISQQEIRRSGFEAYLTKPIKRALLLETMVKVAALPTTAAEPPAALPAGSRPARKPSAPVHVSPQRILLAEDNAVNQKLALTLLRRAGHAVDLAENGLEAVSAAAATRYDLILMDAQMPEMDGYEATRAIRKAEVPGDHVPILALTARAMEGDRERCLAAGMNDYLTKPIRVDELHAAIARWARVRA